MIWSSSGFLMSSPLTRAITSGSCAGTGFGGGAAGGVAAPGVPGAAGAAVDWPVVPAVLDCAAGALRHPVAATATTHMQTASFDFKQIPLVLRKRRNTDCNLTLLERMNRAGFGRFGAGEERFPEDVGAGGRGELAGVLVDVHEDDPVGHVEGLAGVAGEGPGHELRPDRKRRLRAAQAEHLVVVEADPDHRQQLRREADEPGIAEIVGGAGLAG